MAKTKISEFSSTAGNNTDIDSINIAEGCAPSGINNAIRELMAQLKDFQAGTAGDSFNGPVGTTTAAAGTFTTLAASGTVSGTGFSNYLASPPAIGGTAAAAGSFTTLSASGIAKLTGGASSRLEFDAGGSEYARILLNGSNTLDFAAGSTTPTMNIANGAVAVTGTLAASGAVTLSGGTANGVAYLNGSKVLTTGSALTFDGTGLSIGTTAHPYKFMVSDGGATGFEVGPGTTYVAGRVLLQSYNRSGAAYTAFDYSASEHKFQISGSDSMVLTAGGNLLVGTTSTPTSGSANIVSAYATGGGVQMAHINSGGGALYVGLGGGGVATYTYTGAVGSESYTERARITSAGDLLVGTTSGSNRLTVSSTANDYISRMYNTNGTGADMLYMQSSTDPNNTTYKTIYTLSNASARFYVQSNGGIGNYQANDVNLSDRREKTNFAPAKSYLETICAIPVQTFNYIDQNLETDDGLTLGVVAQDVQVVAPELVSESNWGTEENPKMRLSIYQTD